MCDVSCTHTKHILIGNNDKNHFYLLFIYLFFFFIYLFIYLFIIFFFLGGGGGWVGGRAVYIYGYLTIIRDYTVVMYKHTYFLHVNNMKQLLKNCIFLMFMES